QMAARITPLAISTPTASPRSPLSPTRVGGRPVLRVSLADALVATSTIVPAASSSSTTLVTVERDNPISASAPRLSAPRSRKARTTRARLARRCVDEESGEDTVRVCLFAPDQSIHNGSRALLQSNYAKSRQKSRMQTDK